jgi:hypothetical protein
VRMGLIMMSNNKKRDDDMLFQFNEGRLNADKKWLEAIDKRIAELELQVGIPELRRLKKLNMYRWDNVDDDSELVNVRKGLSFRVSKSRVRK